MQFVLLKLKAFLIIALFYLVPFFSYSNIYDSLISKPPKISQGPSETGNCYLPYGSVTHLNVTLSDCQSMGLANLPSSNSAYIYTAADTYIQSPYNENGYIQTYSCVGTTWQQKPCGTGQLFNWTPDYLIDTITCPPDGFLNYTYPHDSDSDGVIDACYIQQDLEENSNCSINDIYPLSGLASNNAVCLIKEDGSKCLYKSSGSNLFTTNESCFDEDGENVPQLENLPPEQNGECTTWSDGTLVCSESQENVCDSSGSCNQYCGTVNDQFVCFTADNDNDGVMDYLDPDIDGDGILNVNDPDPDGDGIDNNYYENLVTGSVVTLSSKSINNFDINTKLIIDNNTINSQSIIDAINNSGGSGGNPDNPDNPVEEEEPTINSPDLVYSSDGALFSQSHIDSLKNDTELKKTEIKDYQSLIQTEFKSLIAFTIPSSTGYDDRKANIKGSDINLTLGRFQQFFIDLRPAIWLLCSFTALFIMFKGRL